ncbi:TnsA-like heteromeric transposase endonuclease subunit [Streptomyces erythrochromogenes]|uniref:TnsA-like heteromeric transposase endonuclease subunit n=1 Tax=Streptomyces erythrochromogenes TaxID=285574 RepID=UPI0036A1BBBE
MSESLRVVHRDERGREVSLPAGQAAGIRLTEGEPVWVPLRHRSERSIVTYWWAATTGRHVGCRSLERLSMAMLLDFHPNVTEFSAWTARLEWRERSRVRRFVPDFFARTAAGATVVVACPPASGPSSRWLRQQEVLKQACAEAGWQLGSPRLPQPAALANLRWVSRYRHPRYGDAAVEGALREVFREPTGLWEGIQAAGVPRLLALPRLYHLMWRRELTMDWSVSLGPASVIRSEEGASPRMSPFNVEDPS